MCMSQLSLPGLIDPHVHLRDPGQTQKEDFLSGTTAALAGGYTVLLDMPNNSFPITSVELLHDKKAIAKEKIVCDIGFYFGTLGNNYDEFAKVKDSIFGLKVFLNHTTGGYKITDEQLLAIYKKWPGNTPILVHAEEESLELVLYAIQQTGRKTHICHVSSKNELERIIRMKEMHLPVTCGVTPHHLYLTENDRQSLGPNGVMKPPLKTREDVDFLWKHFSAIDVIESDHAPHTKEEKQRTPTPYGVPGLETTLPLLLTSVQDNKLSLEDLIRVCHESPKKIFGLQTQKDTFITVDPTVTYEIDNDALFTKAGWSPFAGWKVKGKVISVTIRGQKVFENDSLLATPGSGKLLSQI